MEKLLLLFITLLSLSSCSNDGRMMKKFIGRTNAHEYNLASKYIYPGDHSKFYLYSKVVERSPNIYFKLTDKENITINEREGVIVELEFFNATDYFKNYIKRNTNFIEPNTIIDTIMIREIDGDKYLSFNWANISGESLKSASISSDSLSSMNIRSGMGSNYPVIGTVNNGESIIIDDYSENKEWVRCVSIDDHCRTVEGYIYRNSLTAGNNEFFFLDFFGGMGLLIAVTIFFVLAIIPFFLYGLAGALLGTPFGILLAIALVLGWLYSIYFILENILFELFLINLPNF